MFEVWGHSNYRSSIYGGYLTWLGVFQPSRDLGRSLELTDILYSPYFERYKEIKIIRYPPSVKFHVISLVKTRHVEAEYFPYSSSTNVREIIEDTALKC